MDLKKARKILKKERETADYKIPTGKCLAIGFKILDKYDPEMEYDVNPTELHVSDFLATVAQMTEDEVEEMNKADWSEDKKSNSWSFLL